jgi:tetratricopeptide (TPR) repeat protein
MKKNIYIICLLLCVSNYVFAEEIAIRKYQSQNRTAIQSSNIVRTNAGEVYGGNSSYDPAIKEIQKRIALNSGDYELYVSLIDLYLKSGQNDKAYDELIFLSNLARQNKLNSNVLDELNVLYKKYQASAKYDRNRFPLYLDLSILALIQNDTAKASEYISYAADTAYNNEMLENAISIIYGRTNDTEKAIATCDKILYKNPKNVGIRKLKASYLVQTDKKPAAIEEYSQILAVKPDDSDAKYSLYKLLTEKNTPEKEIIRQIYKTDRTDYQQVYYELANLLLKNNEVTQAEKYADYLVNKYPDNPNGYILLSEIYKKQGKVQESYDALAKVRDKADNNESIAKYNVMLAKLSDQPIKEAVSLMSNGLYQQALEVLESADQSNLYVLLNEARANYLLNKKGNTFDILNKAMSLYPENSDVYCAFGYIYLQEKDIETARKYTNKSLKINPQNGTAKDLLDMVNQAETDKMTNNIVSNYESQNYDETMRLINEAMEINKKDPNLYLYKALTYIAQNNYAASTSALYKCIELDKNNKLAYFYLGTAFDNLSEPANALQNYQKYISLLGSEDFEENERKQYALARINKLKK